MKKLSIIFTIVFLTIIISLPAHPASAVNASFNKDDSVLTVTFKHQVKNNKDHFITDLVILKDKQEIIRQKLTYQDTLNGGSLVFKINDLKPKDKLNITATCVIFGKTTFSLVIK